MTPEIRLHRSLLNRRAFLAATGLAVGATAVAACGSAPDGSAPTTSAGGAGFPVTVAGQQGAATVDAAPTRVVSVGQYRDSDAAIALGVVPVATPDLSGFLGGGLSPWFTAKLGSRPRPALLRSGTGPPLEQIAALRPDLILATDDSTIADDYGALTRISPTLTPQNGYNKDTWQVTTDRVGQILGRRDQAATLVAQVQATIAAARSRHPELAGKTFTIGPVQANGTINTISSATDASAVFLSQFGMTLSPAVTNLPPGRFPGRAVVSPERVDLLDADVMVLTYNAPQARQRLEADPLFRRIPAVVRGSYIAVDLAPAIAIAFPSALSIPYGIDQLVPQLSQAAARR